MLLQKNFWVVVVVLVVGVVGVNLHAVEGKPRRILLDSDIDTDDFFALLYILKLNRSEFELEVSFNSSNISHCESSKLFKQSLPNLQMNSNF